MNNCVLRSKIRRVHALSRNMLTINEVIMIVMTMKKIMIMTMTLTMTITS